MVYFYNLAIFIQSGYIYKYGAHDLVSLYLESPPRFEQQIPRPQVHEMLEQSQSGNRVLVVALFLAIVTFMTILYLLKERYKKDRQLAEYGAEKRIARKLHDEIANEIYSTMLFIDKTDVIGGNKKEQVIEQLNSIYKSTRDISRENNEIDTGPHFPIQLKLMLKLYNTDKVNVLIKGLDRISWEMAEETKKIATFRILQELMVNMKKHSSAGVVMLTFEQENKTAKIIYSDNGKGIAGSSEEFEDAFKNIRARVADIDGILETDTEEGEGIHLHFTFTI